ncbi:Guanosine-5'-triphosphate,3'-diphosphate pyrophosphatase [Camellia lanceoleosa]|uniref:Guanosine-5'-triphosphate,3'-diphosphate pyrophosphatase n=1 Tax=Camellia lanceoleosa TaxID=1840588 RepID=A0ACC0IKK4_9ERIC|nr:Guanosine-5'-triphosphate,3'-diphosphate pyrophosphatase [Camellia lanceoleosa]
MATNLPTTVNPPSSSASNNLFAAADMGTNSFKLLIVRADPPTSRFLQIDRLKHPVVLGRDTPSSAISAASILRALDSLRKFHNLLLSHHVSPSRTRLVATSAIRDASNQSQFLHTIRQTLGFHVDVLSGEEEACLTYIGVL